ncbi:MAG: phage holin family protein [Nocardioidaceae bacterium]|nr:phage holin family protein [Nocardioidaceae bacterium]
MTEPTEKTAGKSDPTVGKLIADISRDVSSLVQSEIALAKSELRVSFRAGGAGGALLAVAAFLLLIVLILGSVTIAYFITMAGLDPAWSFLIVTGAYFLVALLLVFVAIRKFKKVRAPKRTIATAKEIPSAFKRSS